MAEMGIFSSIITPLQPLVSQKYEGDITIVPDITLDDYLHIISNPTEVNFYKFFTLANVIIGIQEAMYCQRREQLILKDTYNSKPLQN